MDVTPIVVPRAYRVTKAQDSLTWFFFLHMFSEARGGETVNSLDDIIFLLVNGNVDDLRIVSVQESVFKYLPLIVPAKGHTLITRHWTKPALRDNDFDLLLDTLNFSLILLACQCCIGSVS